jgi:hypothetical protein
MKKLTKLALAAASVIFIIVVISNPLSAQSTKQEAAKGKPIPENIVKIAERSCLKCHVEPGGNNMAASMINLSKWDNYSAEKQAEKAKKMCKKVTKGKMPPKSFKKEHPNAAPTPEEVKMICDWSQSIQPAPKK